MSNASQTSPFSHLSICHMKKLLPIIRELSDFRWLEPLKTDPTKGDHNRRCAYHKEHRHTTKQYRSLHYLVEKLIKAGHLKQYIRSGAKNRETSRNPAVAAPTTPIAPKVMINYIHGGPLDEEYNSKRKKTKAVASHLCPRTG